MKFNVPFSLALLLIFCGVANCYALPETLRVSIEPQSATLQEGGVLEVKVLILSGSSLAYAGEFSLSYPVDQVDIISADPGPGWELSKVGSPAVYLFYRKPGGSVSDSSPLAVFKFKARSGVTNFSIDLSEFKAADQRGNDITIKMESSSVKVTAKPSTQPPPPSTPSYPPSIPPPPPSTSSHPSSASETGSRESKGVDWFIVAATTVLIAGIAMLALYYLRTFPPFALIVDGYVLRFRGRAVVGRKDLSPYLPPDRCAYISRRHFFIAYIKGSFYIQDLGSTNGTYVNGIDIRGRGLVPIRSGDVISVPYVFQAKFIAG